MHGAGNNHLLRWTPQRRIGLALTISMLVHLMMASGWPAAGSRQRATVMPQLQAHIENRTEAAEVFPTMAERAAAPAMAPAHPLPSPDKVTKATVEQGPAANSGTDIHPAGTSQYFYSGHELDRYPVPLIPLDPAGIWSGGAPGRVRLWLRIDHIGRVVDLALMEEEPVATFDAAVRDRLLRTNFIPASKDGRPVKSRILVELHRP